MAIPDRDAVPLSSMTTQHLPPIPTDPDAYLDEKQAARLTGHSFRTYQGWRSSGGGPPYARVGGSVRYRRGDLLQWMAQHTVGGTFPPGWSEGDRIELHDVRSAQWIVRTVGPADHKGRLPVNLPDYAEDGPTGDERRHHLADVLEAIDGGAPYKSTTLATQDRRHRQTVIDSYRRADAPAQAATA